LRRRRRGPEKGGLDSAGEGNPNAGKETDDAAASWVAAVSSQRKVGLDSAEAGNTNAGKERDAAGED